MTLHKTVKLSLFLLLFCGMLFAAAPVLAQQSDLTLYVNRNFGYSSGSQIRGSFTLSVDGPKNIQSVTFKIDGAVIGTVTEAPFKLKFQTTAYPLGWHELSAEATTTDGQSLVSGVRKFEFASTAQESATVQRITLPLGGIVLGLILVMLAAQFLAFRNLKNRPALPLGAPRQYGVMGGAICPKCSRPFAVHWWAFNAGIGSKFDRCDHCGKWSVVRRINAAALAQAERDELKLAQPEVQVAGVTEEEKLKQQIDESRFTDH